MVTGRLASIIHTPQYLSSALCATALCRSGRGNDPLCRSALVEMPGIEPGSRKVQPERLQAYSAPGLSPAASSADRVGSGPSDAGALAPFDTLYRRQRVALRC